jgi:hypothetical protein
MVIKFKRGRIPIKFFFEIERTRFRLTLGISI